MSNPRYHGSPVDKYSQEIFDSWNLERFNKAIVCERCKKNPPTDIMRYTSYIAVCESCRDFLLEDMKVNNEGYEE